MKRAWKCYNCRTVRGVKGGFDFEAEKPICPQCKADGTTERGRHAVQARVVMHFDPPSEVYGKGLNVLACRPEVNIVANTQGLRATGAWEVVTCEACKQTEAFKRARDRVTDLSNAVDIPPEDKARPGVLAEPKSVLDAVGIEHHATGSQTGKVSVPTTPGK